VHQIGSQFGEQIELKEFGLIFKVVRGRPQYPDKKEIVLAPQA